MSEIILSLKTDNAIIQSGKIYRKPRNLGELQWCAYGKFGNSTIDCEYFLVTDELFVTRLRLNETTNLETLYQMLPNKEEIHFLMISQCHSAKINPDLESIGKFFWPKLILAFLLIL